MGTEPAVIVNIQRQPGANLIQVVDRVKQLLPALQATLPGSVKVAILSDRTITIRASVHDVQLELMLAVVLVVMIENIARYIEAGDGPLEAALKGSAQIGFTILSLTVSLIAVLIPLLFMGDIVGRLFREFAVTLSVTILVSGLVSLTLTPMLCARLLRHKPESARGWFYRTSERLFDSTIRHYGTTLRAVLRHQTATLFIAVATLGATVWLYAIVPKGFFPIQDTGVLLG